MKKAPRTKAAAVIKPARASREEGLFARVIDIIEAARGHVTRSVNTAMVQAYWLIGREIVEGEKRSGHGDELIDRLARRLARSVGPGFGARTLRRTRVIESSQQPPGDEAVDDVNVMLFTRNDQGWRGFIPQAAGPA
ncbi:MAG: DUF1016 N-terminal domain-containing protein [Deltaproteobacteria bacterium]